MLLLFIYDRMNIKIEHREQNTGTNASGGMRELFLILFLQFLV